MDQVKNFVIDFMGVFYEAMPFIVLGAILSGLIEELVPQQVITRFIPRSRFVAIGLGALLGLIFPMCECGIVPVMRRLLRKGLPLSCCVAYMLAGPIINVVVFLSTWVAFAPHAKYGGYYIIGLRMGLGFLVAVGTALIVERMHRKYGDAELLKPEAIPTPPTKTVQLGLVGEPAAHDDVPAEARKPLLKRLGAVSETALHDFVDIAVFLCLGALLASVTQIFLDKPSIGRLSAQYPALAILAMMAVAVVMCLCSEADAFVAASFTTMHPSAKLAFLVLGPMLDFKLMMLFTRVYRGRLIRTIIIALVVQVFLYAVALHYLWGLLQLPRPVTTG